MRVVVVGASGNLGTSVLGALANEPSVTEVVGIARRRVELDLPKVQWHQADVATSDLTPAFTGADAVIHLAWEIRPSHRMDVLHDVNINGSRRVFEAAVKAGAKAVICASSVGVYSPGPKVPVDETHPREGVPTSHYSQEKVAVEHSMDEMEAKHPDVRWVRIRPGLIFKRESATHVRRLFLGSLYPAALLRRRPVPFVPRTAGFVLPAVHASDVADAFVRALTRDVTGAFNVAADPPLDSVTMSKALGVPSIPIPPKLLRAVAHATWRAHLQPSDPGWVDMALQLPLLNSNRAHNELGWQPDVTATHALVELVHGMGDGAHFDTPPLQRAVDQGSGLLRNATVLVRQRITSIGQRHRK
jgi:UDP-glucose 4-epimerase